MMHFTLLYCFIVLHSCADNNESVINEVKLNTETNQSYASSTVFQSEARNKGIVTNEIVKQNKNSIKEVISYMFKFLYIELNDKLVSHSCNSELAEQSNSINPKTQQQQIDENNNSDKPNNDDVKQSENHKLIKDLRKYIYRLEEEQFDNYERSGTIGYFKAHVYVKVMRKDSNIAYNPIRIVFDGQNPVIFEEIELYFRNMYGKTLNFVNKYCKKSTKIEHTIDGSSDMIEFAIFAVETEVMHIQYDEQDYDVQVLFILNINKTEDSMENYLENHKDYDKCRKILKKY
ncbi:hypothetical protein BDAP_001102 [Binucleata daphniae]